MLSGTTAFVLTEEGTKLTRGTVRKAFTPKGLTVEKVSKKEVAKPKEAYHLTITGGT